MVLPVEFGAENFAGLNTFTYYLKNGCYAVKGINHDKEGQQSNGSGKSSFMDVLPICLLGDSVNSRNVKTYVTRSVGDNFRVWAKLMDSGDEYFIERTIFKSSKSAILSISKNGKVIPEIPSKAGFKFGVDTKKGNEFIINLLGITKKDLFSYYFVSSDQYKPFLKKSDSEILSLISRLANTSVIDKSIDLVKDDLISVNAMLESIDRSIIKSESSRDTIIELVNGISSEKPIDFSSKKESEQKIVDELSLELSRLNLLKKSIPKDVDKKISELVKLIRDCRLKLSGVESKEITLKSHLDNKSKCPKCDHSYSLSIDDTLNDLKEQISSIPKVKRSIKNELSNLKSKLSNLEDVNRNSLEIEKSISKVESDINHSKSLISEIESKDKIANDRLLEVEGLNNKVDIIKADLDKLISKKKNAKSLQDELNLWISNFDKFKFHLIKRPIKMIESYANDYLNSSGSLMRLEIDLNKELRDGSSRQTINAMVIDENGDRDHFVTYSGGERVRINVSVELAVQQIINSNANGFGYYSNDEMLNPLDSKGTIIICKAFSDIGYPILFATHAGKDVHFENSIFVERKDQKATIS